MSDSQVAKFILKLNVRAIRDVTGAIGSAGADDNPEQNVAFYMVNSLANGSAASQANQHHNARLSISASSASSLDLAGVLTNGFGRTLTFTKVKALIVKASASNSADVEVGAAASNAFATMFGDVSDKVLVKPGGAFAFFAPSASGAAVTAGTGDILKIAGTGGAAVACDILITGVGSAA